MFAGLLWVLLAVWLEDKLHWLWNKAYGIEGGETYSYTLVQAYRELFFL